jgi:hypothetical protein
MSRATTKAAEAATRTAPEQSPPPEFPDATPCECGEPEVCTCEHCDAMPETFHGLCDACQDALGVES